MEQVRSLVPLVRQEEMNCFEIEVQNGRLVLFRGDVDHGTGQPSKFKGMRYCIGGSVHHIIDKDKFHKDNLGKQYYLKGQ